MYVCMCVVYRLGLACLLLRVCIWGWFLADHVLSIRIDFYFYRVQCTSSWVLSVTCQLVLGAACLVCSWANLSLISCNKSFMLDFWLVLLFQNFGWGFGEDFAVLDLVFSTTQYNTTMIYPIFMILIQLYGFHTYFTNHDQIHVWHILKTIENFAEFCLEIVGSSVIPTNSLERYGYRHYRTIKCEVPIGNLNVCPTKA